MNNNRTPLNFLLMITALLSLAACGGGTGGDGGGGGGGNPLTPNSTVEEVLEDLGVNMNLGARVDDDGDDLPEDYAPLGSGMSLNRYTEILLFGVAADDAEIAESGNEMPLSNLVPAAGNSYDWELLHDEPLANTPWTDPSVKRAVANADLDGDGMDEIAIVYQDGGDVELVIMQDAHATTPYELTAPVTIDSNTWYDLFVAAGDFDGDGDADLMLGGIDNTREQAQLKMIANDAGSFAFNGNSITIPWQNYLLSQLILVAGNVDYDKGIELAVAVNAGSLTNNSNSQTATVESWYAVYDDAMHSLAVLDSGQLEVDNGSGTTRAAYTNIALGDLDGDGLDEIVLAGLDNIGGFSGSIGYDDYSYLIEALDDGKRGFASLADGMDVTLLDGEQMQPSASGSSQYLNFVATVTADLDGDGADEFLVGQHLFNSMATSPGLLSYYDDNDDAADGVAKIPSIHWYGPNNSSTGTFNLNWKTVAIAAGDVTKDARENIVFYVQRDLGFSGSSGEPNEQMLQVWGHDQVNGWSRIVHYGTDFANSLNNSDKRKAILLLPEMELDDMSVSIKFSEGSHQLVFTEPLIIAALAGAPCATDLGQDLGSCRTAFGQAVSSTTTTTNSTSVFGSVHVGFGASDPITPNSLEVTGSIKRSVDRWTSNSYTLTKTLLYETGAIEDSVVLTVLPMDVYTYTVLSHVDPTLVGDEVFVNIPREPITTMVTLEFYNQIVDDDILRIENDVFAHIEGDPSSYPTSLQKNSLLNRYAGLESTEASVGEGTGQTVATIQDFSSTSTGADYRTEYSLNVRATGGLLGGYVIGGFEVGGGSGSALEITHGNETIYQGSVGNISAAAFNAGEDYNWGLFTYLYDDHASGQEFEVLNFWVTP